MLEKSNYYPGQNSKEEILHFIRRHWIAYVKWIIILTIMILSPIIITIILLNNNAIAITESNKYYFVIFFSLYSLLVMAVFITTWIDYYLDVTIITRQHLIHVRQIEIFNRIVSEQSLLRVQDVSSDMKGLYQTLFRFGTVYVETAGEQPNFRMTDIAKPHQVAKAIMEIHEELVEDHELGHEISEGIGMDRIKPIKNEIDNDNNIKTEFADENKEEIINLEPNNEEKIIIIQNPKNKINNKKPISPPKSKIKKIEIPNKIKESKVFKIEKSWIKQEMDSKQNIDKKDNFIAKKISQNSTPPNSQSFTDINIEGEIKEGEEIKF